MWRSSLLVLTLFCNFFGRLHGAIHAFGDHDREERKNSFYVSRKDTGEAICVEPIVYDEEVFPTFELDKLEFVGEEKIVEWGPWLREWQFDAASEVNNETRKMFIAGDRPFQFLHQMKKLSKIDFNAYILASNISLWISKRKSPRSNGYLIEIDHWNETTKVKDTTVKYCDRMPEDGQNVNCLVYDRSERHSSQKDLLNGANDWAFLRFRFYDGYLELHNIRGGLAHLLAQWSSEEHGIKNGGNVKWNLFAKSHKRNAAFYMYNKENYPDYSYVAESNEMKRSFLHRNSGRLCVKIKWKGSNAFEPSQLQVKNLDTGRVSPEPKMNFTIDDYRYYTDVEFHHLDAGNYEMSLWDITRPILHIDLCPGNNIKKTWTHIPKTIKKCRLRLDNYYTFSAWPSYIPNPKLNPKWSLDEWAYVCDRLGIGSNDTAVPIKLCNLYGCNFSKCPHLQGEQTKLFKCKI